MLYTDMPECELHLHTVKLYNINNKAAQLRSQVLAFTLFIGDGCSAEQDSVWSLYWPCTEAEHTAVVDCPNSAEGAYT